MSAVPVSRVSAYVSVCAWPSAARKVRCTVVMPSVLIVALAVSCGGRVTCGTRRLNEVYPRSTVRIRVTLTMVPRSVVFHDKWFCHTFRDAGRLAWCSGSVAGECCCRVLLPHLSPVVIDRIDQVDDAVVIAAHPRATGVALPPVRAGVDAGA
jgi:hypothetical protein